MGIRILGLEKGAYLHIKARLSSGCFKNVDAGELPEVYDVELAKAASIYAHNDEIYISYGYEIAPLCVRDFIEVRI